MAHRGKGAPEDNKGPKDFEIQYIRKMSIKKVEITGRNYKNDKKAVSRPIVAKGREFC